MSNLNEVWKDIPGYNGEYQASNLGRIRSCKRGKKIKSLHVNSCGYQKVNICHRSKESIKAVHRLVAEAFIPNPENKPQINHIDGNKLNNSVDNLEWVTCKQNIIHAVEHGLHKSRKGINLTPEHKKRISESHRKNGKQVIQFDVSGNFISKYSCVTEASEKVLGKKKSKIGECCLGRRKTCGGFKWKYAEVTP